MNNTKTFGNIEVIENIQDFEVKKFEKIEGTDKKIMSEKLYIPKTEESKTAFMSDNESFFISAFQKRSQNNYSKQMKMHFDDMVKRVRKGMKRKGLKCHKTNYEIKKALRKENLRRIENRYSEFETRLNEIRADKTFADRYKDVVVEDNEGKKTLKFADGTVKVFNHNRQKADMMIGMFKKFNDISESELWEIYGENLEENGEKNDVLPEK